MTPVRFAVPIEYRQDMFCFSSRDDAHHLVRTGTRHPAQNQRAWESMGEEMLHGVCKLGYMWIYRVISFVSGNLSRTPQTERPNSYHARAACAAQDSYLRTCVKKNRGKGCDVLINVLVVV